MSYFDLNVPWPAALPQNVGSSNSKKKQASQDTSVSNQPNGVELLTPAARQEVVQLLQMLIHCEGACKVNDGFKLLTADNGYSGILYLRLESLGACDHSISSSNHQAI